MKDEEKLVVIKLEIVVDYTRCPTDNELEHILNILNQIGFVEKAQLKIIRPSTRNLLDTLIKEI